MRVLPAALGVRIHPGPWQRTGLGAPPGRVAAFFETQDQRAEAKVAESCDLAELLLMARGQGA